MAYFLFQEHQHITGAYGAFDVSADRFVLVPPIENLAHDLRYFSSAPATADDLAYFRRDAFRKANLAFHPLFFLGPARNCFLISFFVWWLVSVNCILSALMDYYFLLPYLTRSSSMPL